MGSAHHHPRQVLRHVKGVAMNDLSEMAQRVLCELEEAGEENISSTLNTVIDPKGVSIEVQDIKDAIAELLQVGVVRLRSKGGDPKRLLSLSSAEEEALVSGLDAVLSFDNAQGIWIWNTAVPRAYLRLTDLGWKRAREVLEERGYQWWRQEGEG